MDPTVKVKRVRGQTRISSKHQVTLSVDALARAGMHPGDVLTIAEVRPGELVLRLVDDPVARHAGSLTGLWEPGELDALRDEWR
jgi:hypothetical protein